MWYMIAEPQCGAVFAYSDTRSHSTPRNAVSWQMERVSRKKKIVNASERSVGHGRYMLHCLDI